MDDEFVDINYAQSGGFREVACDGVMGGPTPNGKVWLGFYTERFPLPRVTRHSLTRTASGASVIESPANVVESSEGIVRTLEFGVFLSREEAEHLTGWLASALKTMGEEENDKAATDV